MKAGIGPQKTMLALFIVFQGHVKNMEEYGIWEDYQFMGD